MMPQVSRQSMCAFEVLTGSAQHPAKQGQPSIEFALGQRVRAPTLLRYADRSIPPCCAGLARSEQFFGISPVRLVDDVYNVASTYMKVRLLLAPLTLDSRHTLH